MQPKQKNESVPPGFSRPLTVGEVPLMACSDHNRHPDAPAKRTYRMVLGGSDKQARGYHALRMLRLRRVHMKQRWQHLALISITAFVGLSLIFWNQITFPALVYIQNARLPVYYTPSQEDELRCDASSLPSVYRDDDLSSWGAPERAELLQEAWVASLPLTTRKVNYKTNEANMCIMEIVSRTLSASHIDHAIVGDTLVGSYLFQDSAFWNKSLDVALPRAELAKVQGVLQKVKLVDAIDGNRAYSPAALRQWLVNSKARLELEEVYNSGRGGRIFLSSQSGALTGQFASLQINVRWWTVEERAPEDNSKDFENSTSVVVLDVPVADGSADTVRIPESEWFPLTTRPLGLLTVPAPVNPMFYVNAQYNEAEPPCGNRNSASSSGFLSLRQFVAGSCSILRNSYFHIERDQVKEDCFRELLFFGGKPRSVAYVGGKFSPAEKFSSWFLV
ncbi:putative transmembrane protein [Toxoplasma gondii TgCatPRC2]|uniref:Transmembrane protein n=11 Tax=Toxoplasma gondii TaxID=5811 RepID=S7WFP9_TOXGG|nr:hypothetical protein TGGT1_278700 [Toxoplasma gondii GT1]KAF4638909.1 hypothetical protein TGRH88_065180 [Toxoplasma gondii]KFG31993.1 putative transmembrane protein [Toxoplasma gondii p89]KFG34621.1 putative transmembrane protein [Toxoplasma gondii GAB2-2007-GAL-DOM2]KFG46187.1 putative transmembrane protein [Toxoplasma gondii FOU]KFG58538.1 putative transmembrane protein [Toxoplasma gondii RUB]KFH09264.1 putative transmembrane protein [Toxoplasma gondii VAND]KFH12406.1 putative transmem